LLPTSLPFTVRHQRVKGTCLDPHEAISAFDSPSAKVAGFIVDVYRGLLGRDPDQVGMRDSDQVDLIHCAIQGAEANLFMSVIKLVSLRKRDLNPQFEQKARNTLKYLVCWEVTKLTRPSKKGISSE
jgi:hypothetical protein